MRPPVHVDGPGPRVVVACLSALGVLLAVACGDETEDANLGQRTCGDGVCSIATCESMIRCPDDCGVCVGSQCTSVPVSGACGEPCVSSCDCGSQAELCTADFGLSPGHCVPTGCIDCLQSCQYAPGANGVCPTHSCP